MIFKLSLKRLFKPLIRLCIIVAAIFFIGFFYAGGYDSTLLSGFIIIACIPTVPTIYLFLEYLIATKRQIIEITEDIIKVTHKNSECFIYTRNDLRLIKLFKSAGMEKGSFPYQTAEMYYHAEIFTSANKKIVITSVMEPSIENALSLLKDVDLEVKRTIYSTINI